MVEDPLVVSNPIGGSAYLSMVCLDLKISILSVELDVVPLFWASQDMD